MVSEFKNKLIYFKVNSEFEATQNELGIVKRWIYDEYLEVINKDTGKVHWIGLEDVVKIINY
jgi:hypothetical protein